MKYHSNKRKHRGPAKPPKHMVQSQQELNDKRSWLDYVLVGADEEDDNFDDDTLSWRQQRKLTIRGVIYGFLFGFGVSTAAGAVLVLILYCAGLGKTSSNPLQEVVVNPGIRSTQPVQYDLQSSIRRVFPGYEELFKQKSPTYQRYPLPSAHHISISSKRPLLGRKNRHTLEKTTYVDYVEELSSKVHPSRENIVKVFDEEKTPSGNHQQEFTSSSYYHQFAPDVDQQRPFTPFNGPPTLGSSALSGSTTNNSQIVGPLLGRSRQRLDSIIINQKKLSETATPYNDEIVHLSSGNRKLFDFDQQEQIQETDVSAINQADQKLVLNDPESSRVEPRYMDAEKLVKQRLRTYQQPSSNYQEELASTTNTMIRRENPYYPFYSNRGYGRSNAIAANSKNSLLRSDEVKVSQKELKEEDRIKVEKIFNNLTIIPANAAKEIGNNPAYMNLWFDRSLEVELKNVTKERWEDINARLEVVNIFNDLNETPVVAAKKIGGNPDYTNAWFENGEELLKNRVIDQRWRWDYINVRLEVEKIFNDLSSKPEDAAETIVNNPTYLSLWLGGNVGSDIQSRLVNEDQSTRWEAINNKVKEEVVAKIVSILNNATSSQKVVEQVGSHMEYICDWLGKGIDRNIQNYKGKLSPDSFLKHDENDHQWTTINISLQEIANLFELLKNGNFLDSLIKTTVDNEELVASWSKHKVVLKNLVTSFGRSLTPKDRAEKAYLFWRVNEVIDDLLNFLFDNFALKEDHDLTTFVDNLTTKQLEGWSKFAAKKKHEYAPGDERIIWLEKISSHVKSLLEKPPDKKNDAKNKRGLEEIIGDKTLDEYQIFEELKTSNLLNQLLVNSTKINIENAEIMKKVNELVSGHNAMLKMEKFFNDESNESSNITNFIYSNKLRSTLMWLKFVDLKKKQVLTNKQLFRLDETTKFVKARNVKTILDELNQAYNNKSNNNFSNAVDNNIKWTDTKIFNILLGQELFPDWKKQATKIQSQSSIDVDFATLIEGVNKLILKFKENREHSVKDIVYDKSLTPNLVVKKLKIKELLHHFTEFALQEFSNGKFHGQNENRFRDVYDRVFKRQIPDIFNDGSIPPRDAFKEIQSKFGSREWGNFWKRVSNWEEDKNSNFWITRRNAINLNFESIPEETDYDISDHHLENKIDENKKTFSFQSAKKLEMFNSLVGYTEPPYNGEIYMEHSSKLLLHIIESDKKEDTLHIEAKEDPGLNGNINLRTSSLNKWFQIPKKHQPKILAALGLTESWKRIKTLVEMYYNMRRIEYIISRQNQEHEDEKNDLSKIVNAIMDNVLHHKFIEYCKTPQADNANNYEKMLSNLASQNGEIEQGSQTDLNKVKEELQLLTQNICNAKATNESSQDNISKFFYTTEPGKFFNFIVANSSDDNFRKVVTRLITYGLTGADMLESAFEGTKLRKDYSKFIAKSKKIIEKIKERIEAGSSNGDRKKVSEDLMNELTNKYVYYLVKYEWSWLVKFTEEYDLLKKTDSTSEDILNLLETSMQGVRILKDICELELEDSEDVDIFPYVSNSGDDIVANWPTSSNRNNIIDKLECPEKNKKYVEQLDEVFRIYKNFSNSTDVDRWDIAFFQMLDHKLFSTAHIFEPFVTAPTRLIKEKMSDDDWKMKYEPKTQAAYKQVEFVTAMEKRVESLQDIELAIQKMSDVSNNDANRIAENVVKTMKRHEDMMDYWFTFEKFVPVKQRTTIIKAINEKVRLLIKPLERNFDQNNSIVGTTTDQINKSFEFALKLQHDNILFLFPAFYNEYLLQSDPAVPPFLKQCRSAVTDTNLIQMVLWTKTNQLGDNPEEESINEASEAVVRYLVIDNLSNLWNYWTHTDRAPWFFNRLTQWKSKWSILFPGANEKLVEKVYNRMNNLTPLEEVLVKRSAIPDEEKDADAAATTIANEWSLMDNWDDFERLLRSDRLVLRLDDQHHDYASKIEWLVRAKNLNYKKK